jgi:DNA-binding GntR family transcriptional regulator
VKRLTLEEIKDYLGIIGALEASVLLDVYPRLTVKRTDRMERLNAKMVTALNHGNFDSYYKLNIEFHNIFLRLSGNSTLHQVIVPMKQRLYDFPRRQYITEWEMVNCEEHAEFISLLRQDHPQAAAALWKNRHWSFIFHEKYIRRFYSDASEYLDRRLKEGQTKNE